MTVLSVLWFLCCLLILPAAYGIGFLDGLRKNGKVTIALNSNSTDEVAAYEAIFSGKLEVIEMEENQTQEKNKKEYCPF